MIELAVILCVAVVAFLWAYAAVWLGFKFIDLAEIVVSNFYEGKNHE